MAIALSNNKGGNPFRVFTESLNHFAMDRSALLNEPVQRWREAIETVRFNVSKFPKGASYSVVPLWLIILALDDAKLEIELAKVVEQLLGNPEFGIESQRGLRRALAVAGNKAGIAAERIEMFYKEAGLEVSATDVDPKSEGKAKFSEVIQRIEGLATAANSQSVTADNIAVLLSAISVQAQFHPASAGFAIVPFWVVLTRLGPGDGLSRLTDIARVLFADKRMSQPQRSGFVHAIRRRAKKAGLTETDTQAFLCNIGYQEVP